MLWVKNVCMWSGVQLKHMWNSLSDHISYRKVPGFKLGCHHLWCSLLGNIHSCPSTSFHHSKAQQKSISSRLTCAALWMSPEVSKQPPFSFSFSFCKNAKSQGVRQIQRVWGNHHLVFCQKLCHSVGCVSRHIVIMQQPITSAPKLSLFHHTSLKLRRMLQ